MKKFRKIMSACAVIAMCGAGLTGCGGSKTGTSQPAAPAAPAEKTYKIGICN